MHLRIYVIFLCFLLAWAGCEQSLPVVKSPSGNNGSFDRLSAYGLYTPVKIDIMPLTEFVGPADIEEPTGINVYVSLLDSFDCQGKAPGVFRFELYEYEQLSPEPKGKRIVLWPDIDLTAPAENNRHWRDFLRAYEFNLDFEPEPSRTYILQATCITPDGKRLTAEYAVKNLPE